MKFKIFFILCCCFFKSYSQEKDLNYYIEKAQKNSPLLTDLKNQVRSNTLDSLLVRASYKPQVSGNASAYYAPLIDSVGYDSSVTNTHVLSALVGVKKNIIPKSVINTQANTYKLIKDALVVNKKIAIKDLNKAITSQYIVASGTSEQITYNQKVEKLLKDEASILKKLTQNSVYKQTDYLIFISTVKQQELTVLQFKQQYQSDLALLNYISGEVDTTSVSLKKPDINLKSIQNSEKSIFFKQFEIDSLKFQNQNKLIDNAYKPQFSLLADAGYLSSFLITPHKNFGVSVGAGLSIPIYDGGQRSLNHQKMTVNLETNSAYKTSFSKQYKQQLLMLNQKLKQASEIEKQLQSQLIVVEALIDANKKLLVTGDAQITEYAIAVGNLIAIKNAISQNTINKLQLINELNYWNLNE
ncbi:TolC family protein [Flavobacterium sp. SUN052]|uniref:TolC family protein n=1 Tax=Flavobacterium sp. SUN052 TaxID=3002441 RepID=UPI00237D94F1|nr:TolC family protein [Flavobacterium sp. SUN052]MEC4003397.1 TolC family protein [Flavobacterium sp. SUN052]